MKALKIQISGIVQGVGFRPFVYRLAHQYGLHGWVLNGENGVEIWVEGDDEKLEIFLHNLQTQHPPAAKVSQWMIHNQGLKHHQGFVIRESHKHERPTVRISPDLAFCSECENELFSPDNRRYHYPYINCTNCGPRYSIITGLPYDRPRTTMQLYPMCENCQSEYNNPLDRRFHAQPTACQTCGPNYFLQYGTHTFKNDALRRAVELLQEGAIVAIKGIGGYHLACDALNPEAVRNVRDRKFRKDKPFALMVKNLEVARAYATLNSTEEDVLTSVARPIVLAKALKELEGISPDNNDLGIMLPYTPLQLLLFELGAPEVLVLTSANRSSEPIAYQDQEALEQLQDIADAFLIGERPIARRIDDSIVRVHSYGRQVLRRARGYAPSSVARLPAKQPILALGADLKNSITLVVNGEAFVSQYLGDLEHYEAFEAYKTTVDDLLNMYELKIEEVTIAYDLHPGYRSSQFAHTLKAKQHFAIQHHEAHIASVLAEHEKFAKQVVGIAFDGTGYGHDGAIWGGELLVGSLERGFERVGHLKYAALVGGDAAAQHPVQAAAGFLRDSDEDFSLAPFYFPKRYQQVKQLMEKNIRTFPTSSIGRLFDTVAALLGFTKAQSFEGQAAMWLEHVARKSNSRDVYPLPFNTNVWDYTPMLNAIIDARRTKDIRDIARAFIRGLAKSIMTTSVIICDTYQLDTIALSGGVFQNGLLLEDIKVNQGKLDVLVNHCVPCNDGGISLGQAALSR